MRNFVTYVGHLVLNRCIERFLQLLVIVWIGFLNSIFDHTEAGTEILSAICALLHCGDVLSQTSTVTDVQNLNFLFCNL
jgi:hypothetical protein